MGISPCACQGDLPGAAGLGLPALLRRRRLPHLPVGQATTRHRDLVVLVDLARVGELVVSGEEQHQLVSVGVAEDADEDLLIGGIERSRVDVLREHPADAELEEPAAELLAELASADVDAFLLEDLPHGGPDDQALRARLPPVATSPLPHRGRDPMKGRSERDSLVQPTGGTRNAPNGPRRGYDGYSEDALPGAGAQPEDMETGLVSGRPEGAHDGGARRRGGSGAEEGRGDQGTPRPTTAGQGTELLRGWAGRLLDSPRSRGRGDPEPRGRRFEHRSGPAQTSSEDGPARCDEARPDNLSSPSSLSP